MLQMASGAFLVPNIQGPAPVSDGDMGDIGGEMDEPSDNCDRVFDGDMGDVGGGMDEPSDNRDRVFAMRLAIRQSSDNRARDLMVMELEDDVPASSTGVVQPSPYALNTPCSFNSPLSRMSMLDPAVLQIVDTLWGSTCELGFAGCEAVVGLLRAADLPPPHLIRPFKRMKTTVESCASRIDDGAPKRKSVVDLQTLGWAQSELYELELPDLQVILTELLTDPRISKKEDMMFEYDASEGLFELNSGACWKAAQQGIPFGTCVSPVNMYMDETKVGFNQGRGYKPWVVTSGNFKLKALSTVAAKSLWDYFPDMPEAPTSEAYHNFHQFVIKHVVDNINDLSAGFPITLHGVTRILVPVLFLCPTDWPEGQTLCSMYKGAAHLANANCRTCLCPRSEYASGLQSGRYRLRTENFVRAKYTRYHDGSMTAGEIEAKQKIYSQYFVKVIVTSKYMLTLFK
jgi:hypothetical protein